MEKQILILVIGIFALCNAESEKKSVDFDIYKIENRLFPEGVLSVKAPFDATEAPTLVLWADDAGQKWHLESSKLYSAFQLRPDSDESFALEQEETDTDSSLKWVESLGHLVHQTLWYLNDAGSGFTQIKNKSSDNCLAATGMDEVVTAVPCTNSEDQQWKVIKLSA